MNNKTTLFSTRNLTTIAILASISAVLFLLEIPVVLFYKLDLSNVPIMLGTFSMGIIPGIFILLIKSLLGLLHSTSGGVGELADFLIGLSMIVPAGFFYTYRKTRSGAILGMIIGGIAATIVGLLVNLYIMLPFYTMVIGMPMESIISMGQSIFPFINNSLDFVLFITSPFNLLKAVVICIIAGFIYKPLSPLLHGKKSKWLLQKVSKKLMN